MTPPTDPHSPDEPGAAGTQSVDLGRSGRAAPLSRRTILSAAIAMIDDHDLRYLTMRRLGTALDVEAMALYHYVRGREDLLDGIVEQLIDDLYGDPEVQLHAAEWQNYLQRLAHGVRRIALAHPQVFPLIATRPPAAPWVRPPLRSLRWMESFLAQLRSCDFDDAACVAAYRAFSSFLLGHLLLEVSAQGADFSPIEQEAPDEDTSDTDLSSYPLLQALEPELSRDRSAEEFEESLETLLDRLDNIRGRRASGRRPAS